GPSTRARRRPTLEHWRKDHGDKPIERLPREHIARMVADLPPHAARNWLKTIRHFTQFCVARNLLRSDPTAGVRRKVPKSDGHHTWTEDEIQQYEAFYEIGTKARLALALGLYTAQRRGDVAGLGRQHLRN